MMVKCGISLLEEPNHVNSFQSDSLCTLKLSGGGAHCPEGLLDQTDFGFVSLRLLKPHISREQGLCFVSPHHLHWKHIIKGFCNGWYEQERSEQVNPALMFM